MSNKMIKISLIIVFLFLAGCAGNNYNASSVSSSTSYEKMNVHEKKIKKPISRSKKKVILTVNTLKNARIRILNIRPKYKRGIVLKQGKYNIEVSKSGYIIHKEWITLKSDRILNVKLKKLTRKKPKVKKTVIKIPKVKKITTQITKVKKREQIHGNITWNYKINNDPYFYKIMNFNNYIWTNDKKISRYGKASWINAKNYCKNLTVKFKGTTLKKFRLPKDIDLKDLWKYKKYSVFVNKTSNQNDMGSVWADVTTIEKDGFTMAKKFYLKTGNYSGWYYSNKKRQNHPTYSSAICVKKEKFDLSYLGVVNLKNAKNESVYTIANEIFASKIRHLNNPIFEAKPKKSKYLKLKKSEFENTKQYNERIKNSRINIDKKYKIELKKWKILNFKIASSSKKLFKKFQKNKKKEYLKTLEEAMIIKYGKPYVTNVNYNANKEIMSMILKSDRGNYVKKAQVFVKLKYAQKFKAILLAKDFTPIIQYKIVNNKLNFSGIAQIENPEFK